MAQFRTLDISKSSRRMKYGVARLTTTDGSKSYWHVKTNAPMSNIMIMLEFVGYAYGAGSNVRAAACTYAYSSSDNVINNFYRQASGYTGLTTEAWYKSSDGYATLRCSAANYFMGCVVNAYTVAPAGSNFDLQIQAIAQNTDSGAFY